MTDSLASPESDLSPSSPLESPLFDAEKIPVPIVLPGSPLTKPIDIPSLSSDSPQPLLPPLRSGPLDDHAAVSFAHLVGQLKWQKRTGWVHRGVRRAESVAEHQYRMALLCLLAPDVDPLLDVAKCVQMALVHDLTEAIVGDMAPCDGIAKPAKHHAELASISTFAHLLSSGTGYARGRLFSLWNDYEGVLSPEAKFVKDLDKFEMLVQAAEYEAVQAVSLEEFFQLTPPEAFHYPKFKSWREILVQRRQEISSYASASMATRNNNNNASQDILQPNLNPPTQSTFSSPSPSPSPLPTPSASSTTSFQLPPSIPSLFSFGPSSYLKPIHSSPAHIIDNNIDNNDHTSISSSIKYHSSCPSVSSTSNHAILPTFSSPITMVDLTALNLNDPLFTSNDPTSDRVTHSGWLKNSSLSPSDPETLQPYWCTASAREFCYYRNPFESIPLGSFTSDSLRFLPSTSDPLAFELTFQSPPAVTTTHLFIAATPNEFSDWIRTPSPPSIASLHHPPSDPSHRSASPFSMPQSTGDSSGLHSADNPSLPSPDALPSDQPPPPKIIDAATRQKSLFGNLAKSMGIIRNAPAKRHAVLPPSASTDSAPSATPSQIPSDFVINHPPAVADASPLSDHSVPPLEPVESAKPTPDSRSSTDSAAPTGITPDEMKSRRSNLFGSVAKSMTGIFALRRNAPDAIKPSPLTPSDLITPSTVPASADADLQKIPEKPAEGTLVSSVSMNSIASHPANYPFSSVLNEVGPSDPTTPENSNYIPLTDLFTGTPQPPSTSSSSDLSDFVHPRVVYTTVYSHTPNSVMDEIDSKPKKPAIKVLIQKFEKMATKSPEEKSTSKKSHHRHHSHTKSSGGVDKPLPSRSTSDSSSRSHSHINFRAPAPVPALDLSSVASAATASSDHPEPKKSHRQKSKSTDSKESSEGKKTPRRRSSKRGSRIGKEDTISHEHPL